MLKCSDCNHCNSESARFCENCGKKLSSNRLGESISKTTFKSATNESQPTISKTPISIDKSNVDDVGKVLIRVILWASIIGAIVVFWMDIVSKPISMGIGMGAIIALQRMRD